MCAGPELLGRSSGEHALHRGENEEKENLKPS